VWLMRHTSIKITIDIYGALDVEDVQGMFDQATQREATSYDSPDR
jgi:hypothetical protein